MKRLLLLFVCLNLFLPVTGAQRFIELEPVKEPVKLEVGGLPVWMVQEWNDTQLSQFKAAEVSLVGRRAYSREAEVVVEPWLRWRSGYVYLNYTHRLASGEYDLVFDFYGAGGVEVDLERWFEGEWQPCNLTDVFFVRGMMHRFRYYLGIEGRQSGEYDIYLYREWVEKGYDLVDYNDTDKDGVNVTGSRLVEVYKSKNVSLMLIDPWYDASWSNRTVLQINNTGSAENLTQFPEYVNLTRAAEEGMFAFNLCNVSGFDLRFTVDNSTLLDYEREYYNQSEEKGDVWVAVNETAGATEKVFMYWGNLAASDGEDAEAVWESSAVMVQHMVDETNSTILDSTSYSNDGTKKDADEPVEVDGWIDGAQDFDGINDYVAIADDVSLGVFDAMTVTVWVKPSNYTGTHRWILDKYVEAVKNRYTIHCTDSTNNIYAYIYDTDGSRSYGSRPFTPDEWLFFGYVWNGTDFKVIDNGELENPSGNNADAAMNATSEMRLGRGVEAWASSRYYDSPLDEVRIYNRSLSADEVYAHWHTGDDTRVSFTGSSGLTLTVLVLDTGGTGIPNATVTVYDGADNYEWFDTTNTTGYTAAHVMTLDNYTIIVIKDGYQSKETITQFTDTKTQTITLKTAGGGGMAIWIPLIILAATAYIGIKRR